MDQRTLRIGRAYFLIIEKAFEFDCLDDFLNFVCLNVKETLEIDLCKVLKLVPENEELVVIAGVGWKGNIIGKRMGKGSKAHYTACRKEPVLSDDISNDGRFSIPEFLKENGAVSGFSVPILFKGDVWGVLSLYSKRTRKFTEMEMEFVKAVANMISNFLRWEELKKENRKYDLILSNLSDFVLMIDEEGNLRYISSSVERVLGWKPEELKEGKFFNLIHPDDRKALRIYRRVFENPGVVFTLEYRILNKEGEYRWVESKVFLPRDWKEIGLEGAIVLERDVTDRKAAEEKILALTYYDPVTGLPNKILFTEKFGGLLKIAERRGELLPLAVIDIVRFVDVNITYGIQVGDRILREIGERLRNTLRSGDLIGRFFSDRFGVALAGIRNIGGVAKVVDKLKRIFEKPFLVEGESVYLRANIGVSLFPKDGADPVELLRKAEIALQRAKDIGPGTLSFFSEETERMLTTHFILMTSLREAIRRGEIVPYYQAVFNLKNMNVVGIEALARWLHSPLGPVPPLKFIPIAEESGLIVELSHLIMESSMRDLSLLRSKGYELFVGVNFSATQFLEENLHLVVEERLRKYGIPPESFVLEITESTAMREPERTKEVLLKLRDIGVKIAIDDFGTGYSSMSYLLEFDVDKLKIDRSFVSKMDESQKAEGVVKMIIDLSRSIGTMVLAEGIEKEDILNKLKSLGCDEGQGYLLAPPMRFEELQKFLERKSR